ncbi:pyrophosphate-energized vacuolar membrane proton pump-like [Rhodamnia argentea]|uniref:H(+)-exporting diphosphatase n=1 Tax=Rhodamnia argentea TaxID=178133 RepID=A0ABM3GYP2_9MYRT|nr:pyrophosphate-energized vacuolar membrane proton pump-like [Rhodamnia argentea]
MALLSALGTEIFIPAGAVVGIVFSLVQWFLVSRVKLTPEQRALPDDSDDRKNGFSDGLIEEEESINEHIVLSRCAEIQRAISEGATSFLFTEYQYVGVFMIAFAMLIFLFLGSVEGFSTRSQPCTYDPSRMCKPALYTAIFSTVSFLLGGFTSILSGYLGMKIATYANARTTLEARKGVGKAFITAFASGAVMGFLLASNGLLVLFVTINLFELYYGDDWEGLFEAITGYGLGGSSMALFGRVGGGIYTKAADVGADLVGKVERNIPEDDPRNPAVDVSKAKMKGKVGAMLCAGQTKQNSAKIDAETKIVATRWQGEGQEEEITDYLMLRGSGFQEPTKFGGGAEKVRLVPKPASGVMGKRSTVG